MTDNQKQNLRKFIAALRSGDYTRCRGRLRITDLDTGKSCFCATGVLCDLYAKETGQGRWDKNRFSVNDAYPSATVPPMRVLREWIGFQGGEFSHIIDKNDTGEDFAAIATYLEKKYLNE